MSTNPNTPAPLPLMDSPDANEIYASEVVGTGIIGNNVAISLATHRWVVPEIGADMRLARVVVARLVLSSDAALQLSRRLASLSRPEGQRQAAPDQTISSRIVRPGMPSRQPQPQPQPAPGRAAVRPVIVQGQQPVRANPAQPAGRPDAPPRPTPRPTVKPAAKPTAKAAPKPRTKAKAKGKSRSR